MTPKQRKGEKRPTITGKLFPSSNQVRITDDRGKKIKQNKK